MKNSIVLRSVSRTWLGGSGRVLNSFGGWEPNGAKWPKNNSVTVAAQNVFD